MSNNTNEPQSNDDYFLDDSPKRPLMRMLFDKEASERSERFGMTRGQFIKSTMGAMTAMSILGQIKCFESEAEAIHGFAPPNEDSYMANYQRLDQMTATDWAQVEAAVRAQQPGVAATIINMVNAAREVNIGFGADQYTHMTQCATRARRAGASDELVLLCVIHDAGKIISNLAHPDIIAGIVRPYVSDGGYYLLRHHMEFQWKHYGNYVFRPTNGRNRYVNEDWYDDAVRFSDEYDQTAFDPRYATDPIEEFIPLIEEFFGENEPQDHLTYQVCSE